MTSTADFFSPWEPPPKFATIPADAGLASRVDKLAEFASRNGPKFVQLTLQKQQGTDFEFLSGGEGSDYYRWILYCHLEKLDPGVELSDEALAERQAAAMQAAGDQEQPLAQLPPDVEASFKSLLTGLSGSRDSIKTGKEWFMASLAHALGLAACMAQHQASLPGYEQQLHILYLANDVLLKSASTRSAEATEVDDPVSQAFKPVLPGMLASAFSAGQQTAETPRAEWSEVEVRDRLCHNYAAASSSSVSVMGAQVQERLSTMITFWGERKVFRKGVLEGLRHAMANSGALLQPAQPAQPQDGYGGQPSTSYPQAAPYDPQQGGPYVSQPDASYGQAYPQQQAQPMYSGQPGSMPPQGMQYAPPDPGGYGVPPQYVQSYPPYAQPGMAPPPYYAPPQYPPQGPPGYAQGYAAPGQPYPYMQQPYPGQPMMGQQPGYAPPAWGSGPMQGPLQPGYPMQADPDQPQPAQGGTQPSAPSAPSFPAGLIPKLVEHRLRTEPPYSPLSPLDIQAVSFQPSPQPSPYILSRLDKFAADLQAYRPGLMRADLGPVVNKAQDVPSEASRAPAPEPLPSLAPAQGAAFAGLGFASDEPKYSEDDAFASYRKSRSGAYRDFMGRSAAATAAASSAAPQ